MAAQLTAAQQKWKSFLGWTYEDFVICEAPRFASLRIIARDGFRRLVAYRFNDTFGYSIYNDGNRNVFRYSHASGDELRDGELPGEWQKAVLNEVAVLTNCLIDWTYLGMESLPDRARFMLRAPWGSTGHVLMNRDGVCIEIAVKDEISMAYRPLKICPLTRAHSIYSHWLRNDGSSITLDRFVAGAKVYAGE